MKRYDESGADEEEVRERQERNRTEVSQLI